MCKIYVYKIQGFQKEVIRLQFRSLQEELSLIQKGELFHKGFYQDFFDCQEELGEEFGNTFDFMDNISDAFNSEDLDCVNLQKYIHGYCDEFALMLSKLYNYEIKMAFRENQLIHTWCQKGEYFIDARGVTNDENLFFSEYDMKGTRIYTLKNPASFIDFANKVLAEENAEYDIINQSELEKLEKDSYMNLYYLV